MPPTIGGIGIDPQGQTVTVTITPSAKVYTDAAGSTLATFPQTISTRTAYYVSAAQPYSVSVLFGGAEIAGPNGNTVTIQVDQGDFEWIAPSVDRPAEDTTQSGTYAVKSLVASSIAGVLAQAKVSGDANERVIITADGTITWGDGTKTPFQRIMLDNTGSLRFQSNIGNGWVDRFIIEDNQAEPMDMDFRNVAMNIGSYDPAASPYVPIRLFSPSGNTGNLITAYAAGATGTGQWKSLMTPGGGWNFAGFTGPCLAHRADYTDSQHEWQVMALGKQRWGPGGSTVPDTALTRAGVSILQISDDSVTAGSGALRVGRVAQTGVVSKTAAYPVGAFDRYVLADATSAGFTVTLPAAAVGREVTVKKIDATVNAVTVSPAAGTIDGAASKGITTQWDSLDFLSDGTNWYLV